MTAKVVQCAHISKREGGTEEPGRESEREKEAKITKLSDVQIVIPRKRKGAGGGKGEIKFWQKLKFACFDCARL